MLQDVFVEGHRIQRFAPEARRFHLEEGIEPVPAQMIEGVRRAFHPFYNGSGDASLRVGQLADGALDTVTVRSAVSQAGPVE